MPKTYYLHKEIKGMTLYSEHKPLTPHKEVVDKELFDKAVQALELISKVSNGQKIIADDILKELRESNA